MKELKQRNAALAVACCSMLIVCIDEMEGSNLFRQTLKFTAKRFLTELLKITDLFFKGGSEELEKGSFDETTLNIKAIQYIFEAIPKKTNEEINNFLS